MLTTKAVIQTVSGQPIIVDEIHIPDPKSDQVVVKLFSTGVCHSQLHNLKNPSLERPMVMGHEGTGVVSQVGQDVTHLKEGDHVIVTWVPRTPVKGRPVPSPLGATYQEELVHGLCFTWAEDCIASADYVVKISRDDPKDLSCIVGCAVLTGAGAVLRTGGVRPGESVAVYGVGGVGLSAIRMASILEAFPIVAIDLDDDKLKLAREFGATHTVNSTKNDPVEYVVDLTNGGADYAFDAVGVRQTNEQILPSTRGGGPGAGNHGGIAILIGMPSHEMVLDPRLFMYHQRTYRGSLGAAYPDEDFKMFLRWHREGKFPLDKLVTNRYRFEEIFKACDDLDGGRILGRGIIEYQADI